MGFRLSRRRGRRAPLPRLPRRRRAIPPRPPCATAE
ncbi:hypothetical protein ACP4OV_030106 [Aristida adscensionis]